MVREIITVSVGRCGIQIGNDFWNKVRLEHHLNEKGLYRSNDDYKRLSKIDVFFKEAGTKRFVPRAAFIDLEPGLLDQLILSPISAMYKRDNVCSE